ncbi:DNA-binding transcriptional MerR regulator [Priestia megaterium]|uniref:helix-turn-helix domain-containing protein n=1 Tax=Priestia megaterium TaxID=1404 RepID=UPI003390FF67
MVKYINEVTREYKLEHHTLRNWEEKGLLGVVERDFTYGRMYDEEQLRRIQCIHEVVKKQQEKGLKRTDFREVERVLLDEFGGMIQERPPSVPASPETFTNMLVKMSAQEKEIQRLQQMVVDLTQATGEQLQQMHGELTKNRAETKELKQYLDEKLERRDQLLLEAVRSNAEEQQNEKTKAGFFRRLFG